MDQDRVGVEPLATRVPARLRQVSRAPAIPVQSSSMGITCMHNQPVKHAAKFAALFPPPTFPTCPLPSRQLAAASAQRGASPGRDRDEHHHK